MPFTPGSPEADKFLEFQTKWDKYEKEGSNNSGSPSSNPDDPSNPSPERERSVETYTDVIEKAIETINSIELENDFINNTEQQELLEEKRNQAKEMIERLLTRDVLEYVALVNKYKENRLRVRSEHYSPVEFEQFDRMRRLKHEALISSLNATIRFIAHTFGNIAEEAIDRWEESLEAKGLPVLYAKRLTFPHKAILIPDSVNIQDRDQIRDWALEIRNQLAAIYPH